MKTGRKEFIGSHLGEKIPHVSTTLHSVVVKSMDPGAGLCPSPLLTSWGIEGKSP